MRMRGWRPMIWRARATRVASGSMPSSVLSGFCGETSHHTSSRSSRFSASRLMWRWPSCAGLNEPPKRPRRRGVSRGTPGIGWSAEVTPRSSWAKSALAAHDVLVGRELDQADRPARMHAVGRDDDLRAQTELAAVGELRAGVVHDDGAVDFGEEAPRRRLVAGDDRF